MKKIVLLAFVLVLLSIAVVWGLMVPIVGHTSGSYSSSGDGKFVFASSKTIWVPDNFTSIQEAVNNASDGDTIFVRANTYYENMVINKTVSLVGENSNTTIIDGNGTATVVTVTASNVNISGFTIQSAPYDSGVDVFSSTGVTINDNIISNVLTGVHLHSSTTSMVINNIITPYLQGGIFLEYSDSNRIISNKIDPGPGLDQVGILLAYTSTENTIIDNTIENNMYSGIKLVFDANDNTIIGNNIKNNGLGIHVSSSAHNTFYHNNFIDNQAAASYANTWDNGAEGNYWSSYRGTDLNGDGIIDTPYVINTKNRDNYPLMGMFYSFNASLGYDVNVISNSTIEDFAFFESNSTIRMYVSNSSATQLSGFCRVCISKNLMSPQYTVIIDDGLTPVLHQNYALYDNGTHRWIYFAYEHSAHKVVIAPDTMPPTISILSPENKTYAAKDVPLTFTVSESTSWIGYSLDGQANVTITGNTTLSELSKGTHSLIVYAKDAVGNTGASETIYFSIKTEKTQPFPISIIAPVVIIAIVGIALLVYFIKVKKTTEKGT